MKTMKEHGGITKLTFAIIVVSFLLSVTVSLVSLNMVASHDREQISRVLAAEIYDMLKSEMEEPAVVAKTMANDYFLRQVLEAEATLSEADSAALFRDYLSGIVKGLGYQSAFVVSDGSHRYYTSNGLDNVIDPEHDSYDRWYTDFIDLNREYALDVDVDELRKNELTVFANARIQNESGSLLGVCGVGYEMTKSQNLIYDLQNEYHVKINLVDRNGLIQISSDPDLIEQASIDTISFDEIGRKEFAYRKLDGNRFSVIKFVESLDWYLVVESDEGADTGSFLNVILMNVLVFGIALAVLALAMHLLANNTRKLTDASYRDESTGLLNRRAYESVRDKLDKTASDPNLVYVIADLNGLKAANDTLGHAAGDELILAATECLKRAFSQYGSLYRIGGDEFAGIMSITERDLARAKMRLKQETESWKGNMIQEVSISCGYASKREYPNKSFGELTRIADERMYREKEQYYLTSGRERRRAR